MDTITRSITTPVVNVTTYSMKYFLWRDTSTVFDQTYISWENNEGGSLMLPVDACYVTGCGLKLDGYTIDSVFLHYLTDTQDALHINPYIVIYK